MAITKNRARAVTNEYGVVLGWDTTCVICGDAVHFVRGDQTFKKNVSRSKPDDSAKCWPHYRESVRKYKAERKARR